MEIISYVGRGNGFSVSNGVGAHIRSIPKKKTRVTALKPNLARPVSFEAKKVSATSAFVSGFYAIFLLLVCSGAALAAFRAAAWFESSAHPMMLESVPSQELEILDSAMQRFAFDTECALDDNGDILDKDGDAIPVAAMSFTQPVTYQKYTVASGDTLLGITIKFGLTNISTLIAINDIDNVRLLRAGQKLRIPSIDGLLYSVKSGDTLNSLSALYHVPLEDLLDVNDLAARELSVGQELFIPGAKLSSDKIRSAMGELFAWPLSSGYRITSRFGSRSDPFTGARSNHTGIDLAIASGTPIKAAMSGKVVSAGYSNVYGNYVIINHGNGYQTLYGHMSKILVHSDQQVGQGTRIGLVGSTGYSTGPHLHFTVYKNGRLVDPLSVLK